MHAEAMGFALGALAGRRFQRVIEIGGRDVNGSVRSHVDAGQYVSVDPADGPGVDVIADGREYVPDEPADLVLCLEVLEHCPDWTGLLAAMRRMLRPGGELVLTCATLDRAPHAADGSPGGPHDGEWYENPRPDAVAAVLAEAGFTVGLLDVRDGVDLYVQAAAPSGEAD